MVANCPSVKICPSRTTWVIASGEHSYLGRSMEFCHVLRALGFASLPPSLGPPPVKMSTPSDPIAALQAAENAAILPQVKAFIGPLEIGIVISTCLYGVMLVQLYNFVTSEKTESRFLKSLVSWVCFLETAHTVLLCFYLYNSTVTNFGDGLAIAVPSKEYSAGVAFSGVIGASVQSFFAYRTYAISKRVYLALPSWIGSLARVVLSIWVAIMAAGANTLINFEMEHRWFVVALLLVSFVVDVVNTLIFSIFLASRRSGFSRTSQVIDRLILWTIETGLLSCMCAVTTIALWFGNQFGWAYCFISIYGKIYSNSLLVSLNARTELQNALRGGVMTNSANYRGTASLNISRPTATFDVELRRNPFGASTWEEAQATSVVDNDVGVQKEGEGFNAL